MKDSVYNTHSRCVALIAPDLGAIFAERDRVEAEKAAHTQELLKELESLVYPD